MNKRIRRVEDGELTTLTGGGKPDAKLRQSSKAVRPFGIDDGQIHLAADFDAPLPPEIARPLGVEFVQAQLEELVIATAFSRRAP